MRLITFIKDKALYIILNICVSGFSALLLYMVTAELFFILFIPCIYLMGCIAVLLIEFIRKNSYYKKLYEILDSIDKKCLLSEIIEEPRFIEGQILYDVMKTTNKAMNDEIARYSLSSAEYREYIELWVHEIKTPIAGAKLLCENTGNSVLLDSLQRIDKYVEQALFYSRSNNVEKDFLIKEAEIRELISGVLRKNSKFFIDNKITVNLQNLDVSVFTDVKWTDFIFNQILDNSVKYGSKNIKIYAGEHGSSVSLYICDDGIGIPEQDINRIFDKGFTGENGRRYAKSTGLGLYLCKKLCLKIGLNISLKSKQGEGTSVEIIFPKSNMHNIL